MLKRSKTLMHKLVHRKKKGIKRKLLIYLSGHYFRKTLIPRIYEAWPLK